MAQQRYNTLVPIGQITVTGGTPVALDVNCGALGGQLQSSTTFQPSAVPGQALRQVILTNSAASSGGNVYLLPVGKTFAANPTLVFACIQPGQTLAIPNGQPFENGILPENFVLDSDSGKSPVVYGLGILS